MGHVNLTNPTFNGHISVDEEGLEPFLATGWSREDEGSEKKPPAKKTAAKKTAAKEKSDG